MRMNCTPTMPRNTASSSSGLLWAYGYGGRNFWMRTSVANTNANAHRPKAANPKKESGLVEYWSRSFTVIKSKSTRDVREREYFELPNDRLRWLTSSSEIRAPTHDAYTGMNRCISP